MIKRHQRPDPDRRGRDHRARGADPSLEGDAARSEERRAHAGPRGARTPTAPWSGSRSSRTSRSRGTGNDGRDAGRRRPKAPQGGRRASAERDRPGQAKGGRARRRRAAGADGSRRPRRREGTPRLQEYYEKTVRGQAPEGVRASPTRTRCRGWRRSCSTSAWATRARTPSCSRRRSRSWGSITGQQAGGHRAKKAIANFGLRAGHAGGRHGDAARRPDVRVPGPLHHPGDPAHPRLPRAAEPELRRARATTRSGSRSR